VGEGEHALDGPTSGPAPDAGIIHKALVEGRVLAGEFVDKQFVQWNVSPAETLARIDRAWSELGREPDLGDIVWFVAPPEG
jgi:hypothetical protein